MARVLIVGAGVTGLLAALRCAGDGHRVTVLDRGPIPNPAAGSFDRSRVLRGLASPEPWVSLERELGARFFRRVGAVAVLPVSEVDEQGMQSLVGPDKLPHVVFPEDSVGVLEPDAGVLLADRVLRALVRGLDDHPLVTLHRWHTVRSVDPEARQVMTAHGVPFDADALLLATGPWTRELLPVDTVVHRQTVVHLTPPDDLAAWWEGAPAMGGLGPDGRGWLVPPGDGAPLVISTSAACRNVTEVTDRAETEPRWAAAIAQATILTDPDRYRVLSVHRGHYVDGDGALTRIAPGTWARPASGGGGFRTAPGIAAQFAESVARGEES